MTDNTEINRLRAKCENLEWELAQALAAKEVAYEATVRAGIEAEKLKQTLVGIRLALDSETDWGSDGYSSSRGQGRILGRIRSLVAASLLYAKVVDEPTKAWREVYSENS